ncbi:hypothetical protein FQR65_LT06418 [Abscondita terminalis]|nr:hypothetical protein FQR65_LT06418 [Abscondita terminalis]
MKGKKKGGLANRLARMSDEERTKYLQRKADAEEEARRRKEQLLTNFMKNKLKKEDAFSRLNVAKINQYWHQIMRVEKCEYMKKDVEHLRRWINKTMSIKNNSIQKLVDELDWQEDLYGKNFDAHSKHIENILAFHKKNLDQLSNQYGKDQRFLLHIGTTERNEIEERGTNETEHLKGIIYGQEINFKNEQTKMREIYIKKMDEAVSDYKMELRQTQKEHEKIICALWKEISNVVISQLQQTELKRLHLAELQKLDNAASSIIAQHNQEMSKQEQEILKLQRIYHQIFTHQEEQIEQLQQEIEVTTRQFFGMRKTLMQNLNHDEKQLQFLTSCSNEAIKNLEAKCVKGKHLLHLARSCSKLESQDEKINKWAVCVPDFAKQEDTSDKQLTLPKIRPKTSISKPPQIKYMRKLRSEEIFVPSLDSSEVFTVKTRLVRNLPIREDSITIEKKVLSKKLSRSDLAQSKSSTSHDSSSKSGLGHLNQMEGLWMVYNKVELDCLDLKKQKKRILAENEKLKEEIRNVLEASALGQHIFKRKYSNGFSAKRRFAFSAPVSSSTVH